MGETHSITVLIQITKQKVFVIQMCLLKMIRTFLNEFAVFKYIDLAYNVLNVSSLLCKLCKLLIQRKLQLFRCI